jgi:DNA polymerase
LRSGDLAQVEMFHDRPTTFVADCIRSMLVAAPGKILTTADFSNIEGRVLAWLADQDDLIELFHQNGPIYERMGAAIFEVPVEEVIAKGKSSKERDLGKRAVLGCGYGMGPPKFKATCKKEGNLKIPIEMAERAVYAYRDMNPRIMEYHKELERAAILAIKNPGETVAAGRIKYRKNGSFLRCQLPSGRCLTYPYPRLAQMVWTEDTKTKQKGTKLLAEARKLEQAGKIKIDGDPFWSLVYKGVNSRTKKWGDINAYGGLLAENVTQATARDLLAEAMLRVEAAGYLIVLTVHDEIVSETDEDFGSQAEFDGLMATTPPWAAGCPVAVEGWRERRYRK